MTQPSVILGISGASGAALGLWTARHLAALGVGIELVMSPAAERTLAEECPPEARAELETLATARHPVSDIGARIASGSAPVAGMIVAPCWT